MAKAHLQDAVVKIE